MSKKITYSAQGQALKRLGIVKYDFRKPLSRGQKSNITKQIAKFGNYIKHPEQYHAPIVRSTTTKQLKGAGYLVTPRGRAIIPLKGNDKASVSNGTIIFESPGVKTKTYLVSADKFHSKLKKLSESKLERNQMITVQIGNNASFSRARFTSYAELYYYLQQWEPDDDDYDGNLKNRLMAQMSIVTITKKAKAKQVHSKGTPVKTRK